MCRTGRTTSSALRTSSPSFRKSKSPSARRPRRAGGEQRLRRDEHGTDKLRRLSRLRLERRRCQFTSRCRRHLPRAIRNRRDCHHRHGTSNTVAFSSILRDGQENITGATPPGDERTVYKYTGYSGTLPSEHQLRGTPTACEQLESPQLHAGRRAKYGASASTITTPQTARTTTVLAGDPTAPGLGVAAGRPQQPLGRVNALMGDGSVRFVRDSVDPQTWRNASTSRPMAKCRGLLSDVYFRCSASRLLAPRRGGGVHVGVAAAAMVLPFQLPHTMVSGIITDQYCAISRLRRRRLACCPQRFGPRSSGRVLVPVGWLLEPRSVYEWCWPGSLRCVRASWC